MVTGNRGRKSPLAVAVPIAVAGLVVALAVPQCRRVKSRAGIGEVQRSLRAAFTLQLARNDLEHRYVANPLELGFSPAPGDPYTYFFADPTACAAPLENAPEEVGPCLRLIGEGHLPAGAPARPVIQPLFVGGPDGRYLITATANLDDDAQLDSWSIASYGRRGGALSGPETCAAGDTPAGEPCHDAEDLQP